MNDDLTDLMQKHLNATLTEEEAARLAGAMAEDNAVAEQFAALTRLEADVSVVMKEAVRTGLFTRRMERAAAETTAAAPRKAWPVKSMAAAAGIAVLAGVGWRLLEDAGTGNPSVAKSNTRPNRGSLTSTGGYYAALARNNGPEESFTMRRKLRQFFVPGVNVRSQPVSQALAVLEGQWKESSNTDDSKAEGVAFTIAESARHRWQKPEDEPLVSLEVPGISLLTNVELLAAQAGLKPVVTDSGLSLEPDPSADDPAERTWTLSMPAATFTAFLGRAQATMANRQDGLARNELGGWLDLKSRIGEAQASWMTARGTVVWDANAAVSFVEADNPPLPDLPVAQGEILAGIEDLLLPNAIDSLGSPPPPQPVDVPEAPDETVARIDSSIDLLIQNMAEHALLPSVNSNPPDADVDSSFSDAGSEDSSFLVDRSLQSEIQAAGDKEGYTIDLNLTPEEIIDFDGFINYSLLQTTGIDGLSGDNTATLTRLLAAHGIPASDLTYDSESGVITARGSYRSLRAANVAATAIHESATAGMAAEMRVIEWKDNQIPAAENPVTILTATEAAALLRLRRPGASATSPSRAMGMLGSTLLIDTMVPQEIPNGGNPVFFRFGTSVEINNSKRIGPALNAEVKIVHTGLAGYEVHNGERYPVPSSTVVNAPYKVHDGQWLRFDFPGSGEAKAATVLLSMQPAVINP